MKATKSILGVLGMGLCVSTIAACGSAANDDGSKGNGGATSGTSTGSHPSGTGGAGGAFVPPGDSFTMDFGPLDVPAGVEKTQCIVKHLGNPTMLHVGEIHNSLIGVSHHMIVYKVADTVEKTTPYDCQPFTATLDPTQGSPLMITQKHEETLTLPSGVGFSLDANQMIRIEMHYINPTQSDASIEGHSTFVPLADADFQNEAGFLFAGSVDVDLMPNTTTSLDAFIKPGGDLAGVNFFGFTGHVHKFGTNVTVNMASSKTDPGTAVYSVPNFLWSEPPTQYQDPPLTFPANDGFNIHCDWNNTSSSEVKFGESANDEMCFFWSYYYPNKGAQVCFHTNQIAGGFDLCCPNAAQQALCQKFVGN